jgi:hypothetical protein
MISRGTLGAIAALQRSLTAEVSSGHERRLNCVHSSSALPSLPTELCSRSKWSVCAMQRRKM